MACKVAVWFTRRKDAMRFGYLVADAMRAGNQQLKGAFGMRVHYHVNPPVRARRKGRPGRPRKEAP